MADIDVGCSLRLCSSLRFADAGAEQYVSTRRQLLRFCKQELGVAVYVACS